MNLAEEHATTEAIQEHYDRLSVFYCALWGEHIHHGYWENGESPAEAQVKLIERLAARARIPHGSRVLDVGCGVGGSAIWLARNFGCSVLGITISPVQAEMAAEKARSAGLEAQLSFAVSDANRLQPEAETFDVVWVIECSEHLADKARFIQACARALKPAGVLALCAWLTASGHTTAENARLMAQVCRGMLCPQLASKEDYIKWMKQSGLMQIEAEDITPQTQETWTRCIALAARPWLKALLSVSDKRTRRFVESFAAMRQAYSQGAMAYGMFTARKALKRIEG